MKQSTANEQACYTTAQLRARYGGCAKSTIRRKIRKDGFPPPSAFGNRNLFSRQAVHDWEKIHMPHLHLGAAGAAGEYDVKAADENEWARFRAQRHDRLQAIEEEEEENARKRRSRSKRRPTLRSCAK